MKPIKISNGFSKLSDGALEETASKILASLTGNKDFGALSLTIDELSTSIKRFKEARQIFIGYESVIKEEKMQTRKQLLLVIKKARLQVENIANGDEVKIAASGYQLVEMTKKDNNKNREMIGTR